LEVVAIAHRCRRAGVHRGDVERESHVVALQQQAGALPCLADDASRSLTGLLQGTYDHGSTPNNAFRFRGLASTSDGCTGQRTASIENGENALVQDRQTAIEVGIADRERTQALDDLIA